MAEELIKKKEIEYGKTTYFISSPNDKKDTEKPPGSDALVEDTDITFNTVKVKGVSRSSSDTLRLYFESRRSDGGSINRMSFDEKENAFIEFEDPEGLIVHIIAIVEVSFSSNMCSIAVRGHFIPGLLNPGYLNTVTSTPGHLNPTHLIP